MDKIPAKHLGNFNTAQKYHQDSDFYSSNHGEDDYGGYVCFDSGGKKYTTDLHIARADAGMLTSQAALDAAVSVGKVNVKTVGNFAGNLDMSFDARTYQPPAEASEFLIASVDPDKPLITTAQGLEDAMRRTKDATPVYGKPVRRAEPEAVVDDTRDANATIQVSENYTIQKLCYESYPCKHQVSVDGGMNWALTDGVTIAWDCKQNGWKIPPHFQEYSDWS